MAGYTARMSPHANPHHEFHAGNLQAKLNALRAAVLGANDGIISIAALLVGVASAVQSSGGGESASAQLLLITGLAGLFAGAFSMAAGEYVSVSSQRDSERALLAKERYELEHFSDHELSELTALYEAKGLSPETAKTVAEELTAHDAFGAHADAELGIDPNRLLSPVVASVASAVAYTLGGIIPIVAIMVAPSEMRIQATFAAVAIALVLTGVASARVSGSSKLRTVLRVLVGGLLAMAATFSVGSAL